LTFEEEYLLALCIWREARSASVAAWLGIYWVIQNRIGKPGFRPSLSRVILQPFQFSSFNKNDPNVTRFPIKAKTPDWTTWTRIRELIVAPGPDPTFGALFYESFPVDKLPEIRQHQPWFSAAKQTAKIGPFRFYRA
jgi:spore germination cell wall hydrolase CwlJ-like protein